MKIHTSFWSLLALLVALALPAGAQQKRRIAVLDFDYGTVHSGVTGWFGSDVDIGKGVADILVEKLLKTGKFTVVERKMIDKVMQEQNFSNSDRANPATAAKLGKILGVEALVIGSITQFGRDDKSQGVSGGVFGRLNKYGIGGVKKQEANAEVAISTRLVSTDTAEILAAVTGKGSSTRGGTAVVGAGGGSIGAGGGAVDMSSSNFAATIMGEAVHQATDSVAQQLEAQAASIPARTVELSGLVADVAGKTLVLNIGSETGAKSGDKLAVKRKIREIKDPGTGEVIRAIHEDVGEVVLTDVDAKSSVGTFSGSGTPKVGDTVESK